MQEDYDYERVPFYERDDPDYADLPDLVDGNDDDDDDDDDDYNVIFIPTPSTPVKASTGIETSPVPKSPSPAKAVEVVQAVLSSPLVKKALCRVDAVAFYHQSSPLHIEEDEDDNDHGLAVQAALDNVGKALPNVGQESKEWRDFLDGFKSSDFYDKILKMYIAWFAAQQWEEVPSLEEGLKLYFVWAHEEKKANGDLRWSASTLQTWLSVFSTKAVTLM